MAMTEEEQKQFDKMKADLEKVSKNNEKLLDEKTGEADKRKAAEAKAKALEDEKANLEKEKLDKETDVEKVRKSMQADIDKQTNRADAAEGQLSKLVTDSAITSALDEAGVPKGLQKAAALQIKTDNEVKTDNDGNVSIGSRALGDFIKSWSESDDGSSFVTDGNGGGGASGDKGDKSKTGDKEVKGSLIGSKEERVAAVGGMFSDLPSEKDG